MLSAQEHWIKCTGCCCNSAEFLYSCSHCFTLLWYCQNCIVAMHQYNPLHQVHKWSKEFQSKESIGLADLGLTIQLMCEDGKPCSSKGRSCDLHVLSSNGFIDLGTICVHATSHTCTSITWFETPLKILCCTGMS
jgi:hypothetical protein